MIIKTIISIALILCIAFYILFVYVLLKMAFDWFKNVTSKLSEIVKLLEAIKNDRQE